MCLIYKFLTFLFSFKYFHIKALKFQVAVSTMKDAGDVIELTILRDSRSTPATTAVYQVNEVTLKFYIFLNIKWIIFLKYIHFLNMFLSTVL